MITVKRYVICMLFSSTDESMSHGVQVVE